MALGTCKVELFLNSVWTDITTYVRIDNSIMITRGRQDEQSAPSPATCALTLDNRDGRFTPSYTAGAYYPYVVRNTQLRVSVLDDHAVFQVRFHGEVSEWPIRFDLSMREVTIDVVASGVRRRLSRLPVPMGSVYKNELLTNTSLVGYWPMEDKSGATSFASALAGGVPGSFAGGGTLANDSTFIASEPLPDFTGTGNATFTVPSYVPDATGQQVRWLQANTTDSSTLKTFNLIVDTSGIYYFQYVYQPSTDTEALYMVRYSDGVVVATNGPFTNGGYLVTGCRMSIELKQNGANIEMNLVELLIGASAGVSAGIVSTAGTLGRVTRVRVFANFSTVAWVMGHMSVENHITSIFDYALVLTGFAGELASARATRIAARAGFPALITTGPYSEQMGSQLTAPYLDVFDDSAYVDGGLSTETVTTFALQWRGRSAMYDLSAAPTIDLSKMTEVTAMTDDQTTENDVTVSRTGGGSSRQVATTGLTPAAVGTYAASYDVNVYTDLQTSDQAAWRMSMGSLDQQRFPVIGFDLVNGGMSSAVRDDVIAMREGYTMAVTQVLGGGSPALGIPASSILHVLGWTEKITDHSWEFAISAGPGQPWSEVFVLDSATLGILDTDRLAL